MLHTDMFHQSTVKFAIHAAPTVIEDECVDIKYSNVSSRLACDNANSPFSLYLYKKLLWSFKLNLDKGRWVG